MADLLLLFQQQGSAQVALHDIWEGYTVNFTIYYPLDMSKQYMRINGEGKDLGRWDKGTGPKRISIAKNEVEWLTGEKVKPWEWKVVFD